MCGGAPGKPVPEYMFIKVPLYSFLNCENTLNKEETLTSSFSDYCEYQCQNWKTLMVRRCVQDVAVSKVITHPEYTTTLKGLAINDIMMLKLENSVVFNQWVAPACLPDL